MKKAYINFTSAVRMLCSAFLLIAFSVCINASESTVYGTSAIEMSIDNNKVNFIKKLYNRYVFGGEDFAPVAHDYCTDKMCRFLIDSYEYDCPEGEECYAVNMFRSEFQDGESDVCKLTSIIDLKNGWYRVRFVDLGNAASVRIKFVGSGSSFKIDEVVRE